MGHCHHSHNHNHNHSNNSGEEKSLKEKLKILVPHWIEHNNSHLKEYNKWQEKAKEEGFIDFEELLKQVCEKVKELDYIYKEIEKLLK